MPIALVKTSQIAYDNKVNDSDAGDVWLGNYLRTYIQSQMLTGFVLQEQLDTEQTNGYTWISGSYFCREQIGYSVTEEIIDNGRNDG